MRSRSSEEYAALRNPAQDYELPDDVVCVDWKEDVYSVLVAIDRLLDAHGIEVVMFDTQSDSYAFKLERSKT